MKPNMPALRVCGDQVWPRMDGNKHWSHATMLDTRAPFHKELLTMPFALDRCCKLMVIFGCDLLIAGCCEQFLEGTTYLATYVLSCTCNCLLATVYLQQFICEIILTAACMSYIMKACANLRLMVKPFENQILITSFQLILTKLPKGPQRGA